MVVTQKDFQDLARASPEKMKADIGLSLEEVSECKGKPNFVLVDAHPRNEHLGKDNVLLRKGHSLVTVTLVTMHVTPGSLLRTGAFTPQANWHMTAEVLFA